jgi:hypothetical protein
MRAFIRPSQRPARGAAGACVIKVTAAAFGAVGGVWEDPRTMKPGGVIGKGQMSVTEGNGAAKIVLTREPKAWRDSLRSYGLIVDGERVAKIRQGQRIEHPLPPGEHEVYMKISWCQSPVLRLQAAPGEVISLHCAPGGSTAQGLGDALARTNAYISLRRLE